MDDYRAIADQLAADIASGRLRPGDRLPAQRRFARTHRVAASTASRVYGELIRRGLAVGEVGRGTFVRAGRGRPHSALTEPAAQRVDLELNFPMLPEQSGLLAESLGPLLRPDVLGEALRPAVAAGTPESRDAAATLLSRADWRPEPESITFTGGGRQALTAVTAALVGVGERLGVEEFTYPVMKAVAARLGVTLVPIPMDEHGLSPAALAEAHRATPLRAVYLQPTLHNPLGVTMPERRRAELIETTGRLGLPVVEDVVNGFLREDPLPLAAIDAEHVVLVDSMSKRVAPGLTLGFVAAPPGLVPRIASAVRSGGWAAAGFALASATRVITDGTADALARAKRHDAAARQAIVAERLVGFDVAADPAAYHCWWRLPEHWRAETFVAAAARRGIAVTPAAAFVVGTARAPGAVRLALGSPPPETLARALDVLAGLARGTTEDVGVE
ncbi:MULTISPECIES: PLP-dependent aminotransferase family protein [Actinoalloteichus]|uniref:Transcriptional regulator with HTH domain and aminotransferase domain n=1 Tax=Actinoalloteichus fjordicus TaxID=1612552 RepID=A0AAC9LDC0_9PSEU|nr:MULTISPECIES: PLP-dependent aminotransferase family protein [Actinoalloteichus]APU14745.1 transcriptional regulator with HTH domain and aminotransferase domain [Actinoalloteichus fjordicus]APU20714.1 transcriptional regulator with HTH domain and aminotransferase domain [Actinoalloteichus sp. GBA129-24]